MSFPFLFNSTSFKIPQRAKTPLLYIGVPFLTPLPCWWPILQSLGVGKFSVGEDEFSVNERLRYLDNLIDSSAITKRKVHWKMSI